MKKINKVILCLLSFNVCSCGNKLETFTYEYKNNVISNYKEIEFAFEGEEIETTHTRNDASYFQTIYDLSKELQEKTTCVYYSDIVAGFTNSFNTFEIVFNDNEYVAFRVMGKNNNTELKKYGTYYYNLYFSSNSISFNKEVEKGAYYDVVYGFFKDNNLQNKLDNVIDENLTLFSAK